MIEKQRFRCSRTHMYFSKIVEKFPFQIRSILGVNQVIHNIKKEDNLSISINFLYLKICS